MSAKIVIKDRGSLTYLGYSSKASVRTRRESLKTAVAKYGAALVQKKLVAVSVLNKNRNPAASKTFHDDAVWVRSEFTRTKTLCGIRASSRGAL